MVFNSVNTVQKYKYSGTVLNVNFYNIKKIMLSYSV